MEIWELDLQKTHPPNRWLTEMLNVPSPTTWLGPNVILDFNSPGDEEIYPPINASVILLSICASLPDTPNPFLEDIIPEGSDPAATTPSRDAFVVPEG